MFLNIKNKVLFKTSVVWGQTMIYFSQRQQTFYQPIILPKALNI